MQIAKWMIALVAVWNFGGFVADAVIPVTAKQHLYNPRWPPHAKFHNCQTMVIGIILGFVSLWLLFGMGPLTIPHLFVAAVVAGAYFSACFSRQRFRIRPGMIPSLLSWIGCHLECHHRSSWPSSSALC